MLFRSVLLTLMLKMSAAVVYRNHGHYPGLCPEKVLENYFLKSVGILTVNQTNSKWNATEFDDLFSYSLSLSVRLSVGWVGWSWPCAPQ